MTETPKDKATNKSWNSSTFRMSSQLRGTGIVCLASELEAIFDNQALDIEFAVIQKEQ